MLLSPFSKFQKKASYFRTLKYEMSFRDIFKEKNSHVVLTTIELWLKRL